MEAATEVIWQGAEALRPFLVPVADLEPFPGNPRRGDVEAVRASLHRFGQTRSMLVDAANPRRMVAGHHFRLAAIEEGWTHIAVMPNEFADEEEARAYLLADNRTHDLGAGYDTGLLVEHLQHLAELDALEGTGYTTDDLDSSLARLHELDTPPADPGPVRDPQPPSDLREVVLMYGAEQLTQFEEWIRTVADRNGTAGVSETVYEALRASAAA